MKIIESLSLDALISVSAAMLALLIPVAIFLVERNGDKNDNSFAWDKMVVFSKVINPKFTFFSVVTITVPLVFWCSSNLNGKVFILFLFLLGNFYMFFVLKSCYYWIISKDLKKVNFREKKRFEFLDKLSNNKEISVQSKVETWQKIWGSESERVNMDSNRLIDTFTDYYTTTNTEVKNQLLLIFTSKLKIDFENHSKVQQFVYSQINQYFQSVDPNYFNIRSTTKELFLTYFKICIKEEPLRYSFIEGYDQFFLNADDTIAKLFLDDIGVELIEGFRGTRLNRFGDNFPESFKYDNEKSEVKKNALCSIYFKWLKNRYVLIAESNFEERMFANTLLMFMFEKISPISFFRITEISSELSTIPYYLKDYLKNSILEFANKPVNYIGIGRVYSFISVGGENDDEEEFNRRFTEDTQWTYKFISDSNQKIYSILKNEKAIEDTINTIDEILNSDPNAIDSKGKSKLKGVRVELINYKKQIFG